MSSAGIPVNPLFLAQMAEAAQAPPPPVEENEVIAQVVREQIERDSYVSPEFAVEDPDVLSFDEVVQLGAVDSMFFNKIWFPKTFRQEPADFHPSMYGLLDDPTKRYINIQVCRDGAKTTILRAYSAKRIAYGLSRTILYLALNETKAKQSVGWLRHQIETNTKFCQAFGLKQGKPWSDEHICILHGVEEHKIHVIAFGIMAGVRGVNLDDYRPDLIICDDIIDDENSATDLQRNKIEDRVLGAIKESLAPATETPDAKLVLLNTPQDFDDVSEKAKKDQQFHSAAFGCWTPETTHMPVEHQISSWQARYPTETLRAEKRGAVARNKYSVFAKEKECILVTPETCAFRAEWLKFFGPGEAEPEPPMHEVIFYMAIDPVPPPTKAQLEKNLVNKDFEAFAVVGKWKNKYYVWETRAHRGHDPGWTVDTFFEFALRYRPRRILVEAVAYQAVLVWILRKAMQFRARYFSVEEFKDKRDKYKRIVDGLHGPASQGVLYVRRNQTTFLSQFSHYPGKNPEGNFDDEIEAVAVATGALNTGYVGEADTLGAPGVEDESHIPELDWQGAAP